MLTFKQYLAESAVAQNKIHFKLKELIDIVCSGCEVLEQESIGSYTICDTFSKFIHEFDANFSAISFNLNSPDLFGNTETYKTVDDIHKFVLHVIELIKLMIDYYKRITGHTKNAQTLRSHWKKAFSCYNNMAITLNSYSREFFMLLNDTKSGECKKYDIFGENLLKVFNGEMLVPVINYTGTFINGSPTDEIDL